jgi:hypothetical protein
MASRRDIREAFVTELENSTSVTNVTVQNPNNIESLPAISYTDDYREVPMNTKSSPTDITYLDADTARVFYTTLMNAQFTTTIVSDDEQQKEDIYENLRTHFEKYTHPVADVSDIQSDLYRLTVTDSTSSDFDGRSPRAYGDVLQIGFYYQRHYSIDLPRTDSVVQNIDADNDGTTDETRTTT